MKLEAGKKYNTRGGDVTAPAEAIENIAESSIYKFRAEVNGVKNTYMDNGKYQIGKESPNDLVSEYEQNTGVLLLQLGKQYVNGNGEVTTPLKYSTDQPNYPFKGEVEGVPTTWTKNGAYIENSTVPHKKDLVDLHIPQTQMLPETVTAPAERVEVALTQGLPASETKLDAALAALPDATGGKPAPISIDTVKDAKHKPVVPLSQTAPLVHRTYAPHNPATNYQKAATAVPGASSATKDPINPAHYKKGSIECIDALESATENLKGWEAGNTWNCIKYLWRWKDKGGLDDLLKAKWYLERLISKVSAK